MAQQTNIQDLRESSQLDSLVGQAVGEYFQCLENGERPQLSEFVERYPEIRDLLKTVIPALQAAEGVSDVSATDVDPRGHKQLGDFRILRQIGRGGMGIVYEAEQISMHRRVALKVLPLAGLVDEMKIRRFQNEVRAVAALDHPNIVSVYMIGEERGVHYYAMQLIRGRSLSEVISSLKQVRDGDKEFDGATISQVTEVHHREAENESDAITKTKPDPRQPRGETPGPSGEREAQADSSTIPHSSRPEYFRSVVALGIQAASALQHAHEQGVIHRDIKPGNLLLDGSAKLYVTDFGLARIEADAGVTMTGDLIGTLRYMAPEQALAKRVTVDHRADIYSLAATLYELLTLQPTYSAPDRQQLLKQIAFEEPTPLRRLDREIPTELETIIHKALSKDMDQRYTSAGELADDLRAHLENRPIKAKAPTTSEIISKWTRRNPTFMWAAFITLTLVTITLTASMLFVLREWRISDDRLGRATTAEREANAARDESDARARDLTRRNYMLHVANANTALHDGEYERAQAELDACPQELRGWEYSYLAEQVQATFPLAFDGSENPIFTRDGKRLIAIRPYNKSGTSMVVTWDLESREAVGRLEHDSRLCHIAMSTDETRIAGVDDKGNLFVWDAESGEKLWSVERNEDASGYFSLVFSPDDRLIARGGFDSMLVVVDATNGDERFRRGPVGGPTVQVSFSPDSRWIAIGDRETPAEIIDATTGETRATFSSEGGNAHPTFAPSGEQIVTANVNGSIEVWNWDGEQLVRVASWPKAGRENSCFDYSDDGTRLVSTSDWPCTASIWDTTTGEKLATIATGDLVYWSAFSPSADEVALFSVSGGIRIWRWRGRTSGRIVKALDGFVKARFSPDGNLILASTPMYFHGARRSPNHYFPPESAAIFSAESGEEVLRIGESVYEASWSPDGQKIVATLASDDALRAYDATTGERLRTFPDRTRRFTISKFSPSGRSLVAFSKDGALRVMDFKSGEERTVPDGREVSLMGASFSRDASLIAFSTGFNIAIWDTRKGSEICSLEVPGYWTKRFVFSAGGNRLYVGGNGGLLMEVDVTSGQETKRFVGHVGAVLGIALSPDERQVVSGDNSSGRVIIWDVASGQQLLNLIDSGQPIVSLDWSFDGRRIVAGKEDGSVQVWTLPNTP